MVRTTVVGLAALSVVFLCGAVAQSRDLETLKSWAEQPTPPNAPMLCEFTARQICHAGDCRADAPTAASAISPKLGIYTRCTKDGCQDHAISYQASGRFHIYNLPENGGLVKVGPGGDVIEIITLMNDAYLSFGVCRPLEK